MIERSVFIYSVIYASHRKLELFSPAMNSRTDIHNLWPKLPHQTINVMTFYHLILVLRLFLSNRNFNEVIFGRNEL